MTRAGSAVRRMVAADLDAVLRWRNHPDVRRYMYTQHEITPAEHRAWFERAGADPRRHLLIFESGGVPAGFVSFALGAEAGVADWGFYLAPDAARGQGQALGTAALEFAFKELKVSKVCGEALEDNERSIKFHERLGFAREGVLQKDAGGRAVAVVRFGLAASAWRGAAA
jgi:UDP-4-amino-4,6-dideoxy-N-acetyl-beta-L-altrosamine N-acetyltransferase